MIAVPVDGFQTTGAIGGWVEPGVALEHASSDESLKTEVIKSADESTLVEPRSASAHSSCGCCGLGSRHACDLHIDKLSYASKGNNSLSLISDADDGEWVEMELAVGSGACDTVMPVSSCSSNVLPSYQSRQEMAYEVANGGRIPNL